MLIHSSHFIDYNLNRKTMVDTQLRPNGIHEDVILKAFLSIPREKFLPAHLVSLAYSDGLLHLDKENILLPPLFLGCFLKALKIGELDSVLVIGDRTGYTSALFSMLAGGVVLLLPSTLPMQEQMEIQENLAVYALNPVIVKTGDLKKGFLTHAPYNYIFVDGGAIPSIPSSYIAQVEDYGKVAAFIGQESYIAQAKISKKVQDEVYSEILFETSLPLSPVFQEASSFSF